MPLQKLDLSFQHTKVTDSGAQDLMQSLPESQEKLDLNLRYTKVTDSGAQGLMQSLSESLRKFNLNLEVRQGDRERGA